MEIFFMCRSTKTNTNSLPKKLTLVNIPEKDTGPEKGAK